ncbi:MAG: HAD family hydrolase [Acidobacteriota bacterium]
MQQIKIASWSGPRNISTAMMRSWENRADACVCDEPLYAHYLVENGLDHPGRAEILEHGETNAQKVIDWLTGPNPGEHRVFYQKHMAHHLIDDVPRDWFEDLAHVFLIRDPVAMLLSLDKVVPDPTALDTGLPQQIDLFRKLKSRDSEPPVIDSRDVLEQPEAMLRALCAALDLPFDDAMLSWPAGPRDSDGIWAPHWYASVEQSTGFAPWVDRQQQLPKRLEAVHSEIAPLYEELHAARLRPPAAS